LSNSSKLLKKIIFRLPGLIFLIPDYAFCILRIRRLKNCTIIPTYGYNTRFTVFRNGKKVFKIIKLSHKFGLKLFFRLADKAEFDAYKKTIESLKNLEFLNKHIAELVEVYRTGSYCCAYVNGYPLEVLKKYIAEGNTDFFKNQKNIFNIKPAIQELLDSLKNYYCKHKTIVGDWSLQNLVYDQDLNRIINVDLEGFYTYKKDTNFNEYKIFENDYSWIEKTLKDFSSILDKM